MPKHPGEWWKSAEGRRSSHRTKRRQRQRARLKRRLWNASGGRCAYCLRPLVRKDAVFDHMVPRSRGGSNEETNLAVACRECDRLKANRTPLEFVWGLDALA